MGTEVGYQVFMGMVRFEEEVRWYRQPMAYGIARGKGQGFVEEAGDLWIVEDGGAGKTEVKIF